MLFDDKTKGIAQAYLSMLEQNNNLNESHYKVGERVKCKKSGMLGKVTKVDPKGEGKYYTVKQDSGREMTFAPDELTSVSDVKEASCNTKKEAIEIVMPKKSKVDDDEEDDEDEDEMEDDDEVKIKVKDEKKAKMTEALKGNQHKLDRNNNGKLDAQDFKMLKGKKVKEDVEQVDEISTRTLARAAGAAADPDSDYAYGKSHDPQKFADHAKKTKDAKSAAAVQGAAHGKGSYSRPGHTYGYDKLDRDMRSTNPSMVTKAGKLSKTSVKGLKSSLRKESFTDLLNTYTEGGIKSLLESLKYNKIVIEEESTNDEFTAEIKKAQDKSQGKDKAKVAEPKVDAVEDVSEEVEKHTFVAVHAKKGMHQTQGSTSYEAAKNAAAHWKLKSTAGIDVHRADKTHVAEELDQIEERELSSSEQDKKETYVKGMKKGLQGFKQRYGDKGEQVMYATATKMAKKD